MGPPNSAAGFNFGAEPAESQKACEGAGRSWALNGSKAVCSGPAVDLGLPASVTLAFCKSKLCSVTVRYEPEAWLSATGEFRSKLEEYGEPKEREGAIPYECRSATDFASCVTRGALRLRYVWGWSSGESVSLSVGTPERGEGDAAIRIQYTRPVPAVGVSASAL